MSILSLTELKQISKIRRIKNCKSMSKERLLSVLLVSESAGSKNNFDNARIEKIRKDFNELRDRLLKIKIKEVRKKSLFHKKPKISFYIKNKRY